MVLLVAAALVACVVVWRCGPGWVATVAALAATVCVAALWILATVPRDGQWHGDDAAGGFGDEGFADAGDHGIADGGGDGGHGG